MEEIIKELRHREVPGYYGKNLLELGAGWRERNRNINRDMLNLLGTVSPLALLKPVTAEFVNFTGHLVKYSGIYYFFPEGRCRYRVRYANQYRAPLPRVEIEQAMGSDVGRETRNFRGKESYEIEMTQRVGTPKRLSCYGKVDWLRWSDRTSQTFSLGILDRSVKPVSEFPVPGAENDVWPSAIEFRPGEAWSGMLLPTGLEVTKMWTHYYLGFLKYRDLSYKDPTMENIVIAGWKLENNSGYPIDITEGYNWVVVWYDDRKHFSVFRGATPPTTHLGPGESGSFYTRFSFPDWAYGLIHAYQTRAVNWEWATGVLATLHSFQIGRLRNP